MKNKEYNIWTILLFGLIITTFFSYIFYFTEKEQIEPKLETNIILNNDSLFFRTVDGVPVLIVYDKKIITPTEIINIAAKMTASEIVALSYKNIGIIEVSIYTIKDNEEENKNKQSRLIK